MKKYLTLLKVSLLSILRVGGRKKKAVTGFGAAALIALVAAYVSGVYSWLMLEGLASVGMEELVFVLMSIAVLLSGVLFTAFGASAILYGGKDNDLLLSMPVSSGMLMAARTTAIYLENFLFSFFLLIPAGVAYAVVSPDGVARTAGFWVRLVLASACLPMLDTALAVVLGALIAYLSGRMKHKAIGQNLLMGAYLAVVFWFSFSLTGMMESLAVHAIGIRRALGWVAPAVWLADAAMGDWSKLAMLAVLCVAPCAIAVWALGKGYRKAVTSFKSVSAGSDFRMSAQRFSGCGRALMVKEAKRFFGTPTYLWNAGLGAVMYIVLGAMLLIQGDRIAPVLQMPEIRPYLTFIGCAIAAFCLSTCPICAFSVSLEGKNLWILMEAPVSERTVIGVKTNFQLLFTLPFILAGSVVLGIGLKLDLRSTVQLTAFGLLFEYLAANFGMLLGLVFARPELDDVVVIKRSLLSFLAVFAPMILAAAIGAAGWLVWTAVDLDRAVLAVLGLTAALALVCRMLVRTKGPKLLRQL